MGSCSSRTNKGNFKKRMTSQQINPAGVDLFFFSGITHYKEGMMDDDEIYGLVGLSNLGNTCFMNSALQCLSNVPPLCDYFLSKLHEKEINYESFLGSKGQITSQFAELMLEMWQTNSSYVRPSKFLNTIGHIGPQFADGSQQDSHEFLAFLMDILHEDLNRVKKKPYIKGKDYNGDNYENYAKESWSESLRRNGSIIVDLFQGQTKSTLKCLKCKTVSHTFETFMYLSIPIPDSTKQNKSNKSGAETFTLSQCIQEFTKEEKLEKGELWFCPKCKQYRESTKKIDLWKLPNILIIHLKRFEFNKNRKCKLTNQINFPIKDFDLSNLTAGKQRDVPIYDLFAVSNHEGTLSSGHYTAHSKNRIDQNWYLFNDTQVQQLEYPKENIKSSEAYVLFYSKTSVEEFYRQTISAPESWPHFFSEEKQNQDNINDESKMNDETPKEKKAVTKKHTYQFSSGIVEKRDSKIFNASQLPNFNEGNGSRTNLAFNDYNSKINGIVRINGKSQTNIQSITKFEMMNSVVNEEDDFQGNLDDSFANDKPDKINNNSNNHTIHKTKKLQISPSTIKVRNQQYFGKDVRTGGISAVFSPPKDEYNQKKQTLNHITTEDLNVVNIQSSQNKHFFQNQKSLQQNDQSYSNRSKPNITFEYNIIKGTYN